MVLAMQIGAVGILLDQPILIVGAMVVGPEFGPLAGCRWHWSSGVRLRSPLAHGPRARFSIGIVGSLVVTLFYKWTGLAPDDSRTATHNLTGFISIPDVFSFTVAFAPGSSGCSRSPMRSRAL
jgi:hypothetical protein